MWYNAVTTHVHTVHSGEFYNVHLNGKGIKQAWSVSLLSWQHCGITVIQYSASQRAGGQSVYNQPPCQLWSVTQQQTSDMLRWQRLHSNTVACPCLVWQPRPIWGRRPGSHQWSPGWGWKPRYPGLTPGQRSRVTLEETSRWQDSVLAPGIRQRVLPSGYIVADLGREGLVMCLGLRYYIKQIFLILQPHNGPVQQPHPHNGPVHQDPTTWWTNYHNDWK